MEARPSTRPTRNHKPRRHRDRLTHRIAATQRPPESERPAERDSGPFSDPQEGGQTRAVRKGKTTPAEAAARPYNARYTPTTSRPVWLPLRVIPEHWPKRGVNARSRVALGREGTLGRLPSDFLGAQRLLIAGPYLGRSEAGGTGVAPVCRGGQPLRSGSGANRSSEARGGASAQPGRAEVVETRSHRVVALTSVP